MQFPWTTKPPMPAKPTAPTGSREAELLAISVECDQAADRLLRAMERRRGALVELASATALGGKAPLHNLLVPGSCQAALAAHGDVRKLFGLIHVMAAHRRGFEHQARAGVAASAAFRPGVAASSGTLATSADRAGGSGDLEIV